jgi:hypothetical protein
LRGHLDQIEVELTGDVEGLGQRFDAELGPVGIDEADLPSPDAIVDLGLVVDRRSYLGISL